MRKIDALLATEVREWKDTAFVWGQSAKGVGCDCKGLLAGALREIGRPEGDNAYALFSNYRVDRPVPTSFLIEAMEALFEKAGYPDVGHILLLKHHGRPAHLAIVTAEGRATSALPGIRSAVRERDLKVLLHEFPLHSVWRLPRAPKCR